MLINSSDVRQCNCLLLPGNSSPNELGFLYSWCARKRFLLVVQVSPIILYAVGTQCFLFADDLVLALQVHVELLEQVDPSGQSKLASQESPISFAVKNKITSITLKA